VITTTTPHNLPVGWRFRVAGAGGMKEINSVGEDAYYLSTAYTTVAPTLIDEQALQDIYIGELALYNDLKLQDFQVYNITRPWSNMSTQAAYQYIMSQSQITPALAPNYVQTLNAVNVAYSNWQNAITANQATLAAAQAAIANKVEINQVNSLGYTAYTSGGVIEFNQPVPLTGLAARMQIRESIDSPTVIHEATTQNNQIVLDNTTKTIQITLLANITQNFTFSTAVYSLELYNGNNVIPFINGNISLVQEVTR